MTMLTATINIGTGYIDEIIIIHKYLDDLTFRSIAPQKRVTLQIARFMGLTWGSPGSCRSQVGPIWPHESCYQGECGQIKYTWLDFDQLDVVILSLSGEFNHVFTDISAISRVSVALG